MASGRGSEASKRVVSETLRLYGDLLARPLDEKQLTRPTFKVIQDIVKSLITETRTLRDIFNRSDFESETKTLDKRGRVEFVQKLIDFAANHEQPVVGCVAAKLVAGLEPNKTNELLQSLARVAQAKISGKDNSSNRPRTFTKQSVPTLKPSIASAEKVKTSASREVVSTTRRNSTIARGIVSSGQSAGANAFNRRASGDRPSRATSGTSTRNVSASSAVKVGGSGHKPASPSLNDDAKNQKVDSATESLQQVAGGSKLESANLFTGQPAAEVRTNSLIGETRRQSTTVSKTQNYHTNATITSESDIDKHVQQLRSSLRNLGPVLMDISQFTDKLKERLNASDLDRS